MNSSKSQVYQWYHFLFPNVIIDLFSFYHFFGWFRGLETQINGSWIRFTILIIRMISSRYRSYYIIFPLKCLSDSLSTVPQEVTATCPAFLITLSPKPRSHFSSWRHTEHTLRHWTHTEHKLSTLNTLYVTSPCFCYPLHTLFALSIWSVRLALTSQLLQEAFPDLQKFRCLTSILPRYPVLISVLAFVTPYCFLLILYLLHLYFMRKEGIVICSSF